MLILAVVGSCSTLYVFIEEKNEEVIQYQFKAIEKELINIDKEQDRQWTVINENSQK